MAVVDTELLVAIFRRWSMRTENLPREGFLYDSWPAGCNFGASYANLFTGSYL